MSDNASTFPSSLPAHNAPYCGRFAPSPTGDLHQGSLIAAVASYLDARAHHGRWLVRMEDLDVTRCMPGAADRILHLLDAWGFEWDGPVVYQNSAERQQRYAQVLQSLRDADMVYPCGCSRKEIAEVAHAGIDGPVYPGICRHGLASGREPRAWRIRTVDTPLRFIDLIQGAQTADLANEVGDFVLRRADGLFAYQLAVVVDDQDQGVTHIVRGADLLDSTPRQNYLRQLLHYRLPEYAHIPVLANAAGEKLSKQTRASALQIEQAVPAIWSALSFLGQQPPAELAQGALKPLWDWARTHWQLSRIARRRSISS
ncbi:tRNA glutamyl-Q(34) synthetase GluQRS [Amantichitinum ursilacus]|uniref:Glutamyl-Q tRNA(Asp) synthetase n=1 Tax=Amantichitinum ursilacus TaxID=857265 RepID=A0A0N0XIJ5_9NEIS|nr:tRNA glutamyl-Q(34) synthetase GluQRS [Amantichitinum ursilacus]KPC52749.1 Glutamyl-Q tRNA(Asp) synthetase [Amantichitinum ursilacus]